MAVVGDVYEITALGRIQGQVTENVFHYYVLSDSSGLGKAQDVATAFKAGVDADWAALASVAWTSEVLKVYNLLQPADFFEVGWGTASGTVVGDCLPSFAAYGFRFVKAYRGAKDGRKALAGVAESAQVDGVLTMTAIGFADAVGHDFQVPLAPIAGFSVVPCVLQTPNSAAPFPRTYVVTSVVALLDVTTQNSRKVGIGI